MDLFLAICQAAGLALAVGIGGPLAALFIVVMASLEAGIDPRGTDFEFLGEPWFATVVFAITVVLTLARRREVSLRMPLIAFAAAFGAIAGAASLAEEGEPAAIGLLVGALVGAGSALLAGDVLTGAQRRSASSGEGASTAATLDLIFALAGIGAAALALFVPPASIALLIALVVLASGRRRRAGEKYEGLRILR
jgi:hypothetical protein